MQQFLSKQMMIFIVSMTIFMEGVDSTIINTAIPAISHSLSVNPIDVKITLISYLLSLAVFIPISGWVADKYGAKNVFIAAIFIFSASSLWCGFAHNLPELAFARLLQGLGGSLMVPVARLIMMRCIDKHEFISQWGRVIMMAALGWMLGPLLGGLITYYLSWHWIFWVNIPVGIFTILIAYYYLTDNQQHNVPSLDKLGLMLFGCGLAGLVFSLSSFSETAIPDLYSLIILLFSFLLLCGYFWHSKKCNNPIINTNLFHVRTFRIGVLGNLIIRLGAGGLMFLVPLLLQVGLGYSSLLSGLLVAPMAIGIVTGKSFVLSLYRYLGFKKLLLINTVLIGLTVWSFILINNQTSIYLVALLAFIFGMFSSLQFTGMNSLAYADLPVENYSSATSIMSALQQMSASFGVAVSALLIRLFSPNFKIQSVLTTSIFHHAFFAMGIIVIVTLVVFIRLSPEDGGEMISPAIAQH